MPRTVISVNLNQPPQKQQLPHHNRWHPAIPAVASVALGEVFRVECFDCTGGQVNDRDGVDDFLAVDSSWVHILSGPIAVEGAEPGDLLVVDILDMGPLAQSEWGFTGVFPAGAGGGLLPDHYPNAAKAVWNFEGRYATSRHLPNVRLAAMMHPGIIGCAPSADELNKWNQREKELVDSGVVKNRWAVALPSERGALVGKLEGELAEQVKKEAARTIPPREHGGNCDIKNLTVGSRVYLPVYVKGANLSVGDLHFCQGDGEICLCGAIEMAGWIDLRVDIIKGGVQKYSVVNPIFSTGHFGPVYSDYLVFEGISVDEQGKQHFLDATVAYRRACLNAIEYLKKFGYTGEQAYLLLSAAPIEGRVSGIVDTPNACCTVAIPTQIFNFDIKPK